MVNLGPGSAAPVGVASPPPRLRRSRRWPWAVGTVVVLLVLALVVADRIAVSMVESAVEKRLADQTPFNGTSKPRVSIHGFPFLTQAAGGRYDDIEVSGGPLTIETVNRVTLDAHMHGVHVPFSKAVSGDVTSLPIDHVDAAVTIPYSEAARLTGIDGLQLSGAGGVLHVSVPVTVPGTSGTIDASADAVVHISGNRLSYAVGRIKVAGIALPEQAMALVASQMNGAFTLPRLPYRLEVTAVTATASGVQATARADHIVVDTNS